MARASIEFADTPAIDAFGRLRVSSPSTVFDSKLLHGKNDLVWDEEVSDASGSAASTHDTNHVNLAVGANASDRVIRQTKMRFNYLPGKSHLIFMTFSLGNDPGTTKRVGYFNSSTSAPYTANRDGIWLEHDGSTVYWCMGKGGTERRVSQENWSHDTLLSNRGPQAFVADWSTALILFIDLEWLGVGRVRCGFVHRGKYVIAHEFRNDNVSGISTPYIDSPNHSLRYEIYSDGSAGTLREICGSVQSEGGYDLVGNLYSANRGVTALTTANDTSTYPVLSMRLRSDRPDGTAIINSGSLFVNTTADYLWTLRYNPTVAGTDAASWTQVGGNSSIEYDVSRDNTNTITGGIVIASGYGADTQQAIGQLDLSLNSAVRPGVGIDGTRDELVLCVQNLTAGVEDYYAALNWREPL